MAEPTDAANAFAAGDRIAGYRILRKLGAGERGDVYLGHAADGETARTAALKVYRSTATREDVDREVDALAHISSEHVVRLLDVSSTPGSLPIVVLELLPGGSLAQLLRDRAHVTVGEAVTILASLVHAVADMHAAGFGHGALRPASILFDGNGRPVVTGFGQTTNVREQSAPGRRDDYRHLAGIARAVLERVDGTNRQEQVSAFLAASDAASERPGSDTAERLEALVFALAPPAPLRTSLEEDGAVEGIASILPPRVVVGSASDESLRRRRDNRRRKRIGIGRLLDSAAGWLSGSFGGRLRGRGRQLVIAAGGGAAVLVAALTLLPPAQASPETRSDAAGTPQPAATGKTHEVTGPAKTATPRSPSASASASAPAHRAGESAAPGRTTGGGAPETGDDPVAAAMALLKRRAKCMLARSNSCLSRVDEAGSPAEQSDKATEPASSETTSVGSEGTVALVQRLGDSALVSVTPTQDAARAYTMLMIDGESGWRIREIFAPEVTAQD